VQLLFSLETCKSLVTFGDFTPSVQTEITMKLLQRITAVLLTVSPWTLTLVCVSIHLYAGFKEILTDYCHHELTRQIAFVLLKIVVICVCQTAFTKAFGV
jgi:succinate dehydrogenase hydrophobic anchor subunit